MRLKRSEKKRNEDKLNKAVSAVLDGAIEAIGQIGMTEVETKKTYRKEWNDPECGKITETEEEKEIKLVPGGVDVGALKQITSTLKDIREMMDGGEGTGDTGVIFLPEVSAGARSAKG